MEKDQLKIIIYILILICGVWLWSDSNKIESLTEQVTELEDEADDLRSQLDECNSNLDEYSYALEEANSNIEFANSSIEDAQGYAWSSYEEMGDALDNLETVDTISEP